MAYIIAQRCKLTRCRQLAVGAARVSVGCRERTLRQYEAKCRRMLDEERLVLLTQQILLHLRHRIARQIVGDDDALWQLVVREPQAQLVDDVRFARRAPFSGTTPTVTASPKSGCGTPNTALSGTRGSASISSSTSLG